MKRRTVECERLSPRPFGGEWTATRALTSGGGTGEGVKLVKTQYPYRRTRSLGRTAGQSPDLFVQKVLSFVLLREAVG